MIHNIVKHIPVTTIIISYFFLCGGLFLIGFWGTFDLDISNFITLGDIPKNFILPFAFSQGSVLFMMLMNLVGPQFYSHEDDGSEETENKAKWKRILKALFSLDMLLVWASSIIGSMYYKHKLNTEYWILSTLSLGFLLSYKLNRAKFFREQIPHYSLRLYIASIICQLPLISFSAGRINSLQIYNNKKYRTVSIISDAGSIKKDSTIKFIGFIGDKIVLGSIDNKIIHFINQDSYTEIKLIKNETE